jgi:hypothetical protein
MRKFIAVVVSSSLCATSLMAMDYDAGSVQQVKYYNYMSPQQLTAEVNSNVAEQFYLTEQIHRIDPRISLPPVRAQYTPRGLHRLERNVAYLRHTLVSLQQRQYVQHQNAVPKSGIYRDRNPYLDERTRLIANPKSKKGGEYFTVQDLKRLGRIPKYVDTRTMSDQQIYQMMSARKSGKIRMGDVIQNLLQGL